MVAQSEKRLLSALPASEFFDRGRDIDALVLHAWGRGGLRVLSPPLGGSSELLRQVADRLFFDSSEIIPFYFAFRSSDESARNAVTRLLQEFLVQMIAYRRRDPSVYISAPEVCELSDLTSGADSEWFEKLIRKCTIESPARDERSFIRNCLSAPLRVSSSGARILIMLDDVHEIVTLNSNDLLLAEMADVYRRASSPFVVAGRRRFSIPGLPMTSLEIDDLKGREAEEFVAGLSDSFGTIINEQTRDLIAVQMNGRPGFIRPLFTAANAAKRSLESFQHVEQIYTDEILRGGLGRFYGRVLDNAAEGPAVRRELIRLLQDGISLAGARTQIEAWQKTLRIEPEDLDRTLEILNLAEMISLDGSLVQVSSDNQVLSDTIRSRFRIECENDPRALVAGEVLAGALKRAPRMMARLYRREASIGLAELLSAFDCQEVPRSMLDYARFRAEIKGLSSAEVEARMAAETERIMLPQVVHTAPAVEYHSALASVIEPERAVVAIAFNEQNYTDASQVTWIAAEIDSKLEADRETAEGWCERLRDVAEANDIRNYRIWLIANEGFSDGALNAMSAYNAIGSSRSQAMMLRSYLGATDTRVAEADGVEYEMVIPVGEDTELIAAHALEEIARRHRFPPKSINQLKTALVEACINAAEHGLAPDRKIHQRFLVSDDKITMSISNRGLRLTDQLADRDQSQPQQIEAESPDTRRGWGLNLIRGLMDDVRVEPVDDGTRITMTKFLREEARVH
jgi:serine/threonine-protein kinase RsbW